MRWQGQGGVPASCGGATSRRHASRYGAFSLNSSRDIGPWDWPVRTRGSIRAK
jgi:hypothetical protein